MAAGLDADWMRVRGGGLGCPCFGALSLGRTVTAALPSRSWGMGQFTRARGATVFGPRARLVDVEVSVRGDEDDVDQSLRIVGLPDSALREGRDRIRGAIHHSGWRLRRPKMLVNLAPAAAPKEGASLDLPIALALLEAQGIVRCRAPKLSRCIAIGELSLDGRVRGVRGVLAAVEEARARRLRHALVPRANAEEAAAVRGMSVVAVDTLREAVGHVGGASPLEPFPPGGWEPDRTAPGIVGVKGQPGAIRAATIAGTGGHNLLLWGPPGAGKTLLARQMVRLLPPLDYESALEVSRIHSIAGLLEAGLVKRRPFRAPHHTTSRAGLVGGGSVPRPGELSLAHLGVLFLDELPEFPRSQLEALRQPLEDGRLEIGRAAGRGEFPAEILLVGAMNPCPCGWLGHPERCKCGPAAIRRYTARISGPLRDRFDLQVEVEAVEAADLLTDEPAPPATNALTADQIQAAWRAQRDRARRFRLHRKTNAGIPAHLLPRAVEVSRHAQRDLVFGARKLGLTGRGIHRVLRVARTIADLDASEEILAAHLGEAIAYRGPGR